MRPDRMDVLLRGGNLLTMDPAIPDGEADLLVVDGAIADVGQGLSAPAGVEELDARGFLILPGFVDTHWHLWNTLLRGTVGDSPERDYFRVKRAIAPHYTVDDFYWSARLALAEAVDCGYTTVHNWDHNVRDAEDVDANIRAQLDAGVRGRFSFGPRDSSDPESTMDVTQLDSMLRRWQNGTDGLLHFGVALRGPYRTPATVYRKEWHEARERALPITMHCDRCLREKDCRQCGITLLAREGLLGPDLQIVHAVHVDDDDVKSLAESGTHISVSPLTEMRTMGFPKLTEFLEAGVPASISVDTLAMPTTADVLGHLRAVVSAEMARTGRATVSPRVALELVTSMAAVDLGIEDVAGSLTPGKRADLVLLRRDSISLLPSGDPYEALVYHGQSSAIDTVVCDGRVLKRDGVLTQPSAREAVAQAERRRDDLVARARAAGDWT